MTEFIGRSGADAVFKALDRICIVVRRYGPKLNIAIDLAETASLITASEAITARAFVATASATCNIFRVVADNSGFYPPA